MQTPNHTILFNISCFTLRKLTAKQAKAVLAYIIDTMNGDGIYGEDATKETLLEAYYSQHSRAVPWEGERLWPELIDDILADIQ
jgi:hypothetical protein